MSQAKIAAKAPCAVDVEQGKEYWWCACGRSATQPFCDGAHQGTGFMPQKYVAEATETVYFCACKQSANPPLCDGSHKTL